MSTDVVRGFVALSEAAPAYEEAHSYYDGSVGEVFGSKVMQRMLRRQGKPFKANVIRAVVDSLADRLDLMSATVPNDDAATRAVAEVIEANKLLREADPLHHRACEFGDAFVLVWEGADEGDEPVVNYHSPLSMRIVYDPDNPRKKLYAVQAWEERSADGSNIMRWRLNLWYPDRVESWQTKAGMKPEEVTSWEPALDDDADPESWHTENPYGEVPVFHFRNETPFGVPRHYHGYGQQDAVNKLIISHMSTVDFHVFPQRYALTEGGEVDDEFDLDDDPEFDDAAEAERDGDGRRGIKSGPGEVWWLKDVKSVGQFDPITSESFMNPLRMYLRLMAQTTKTPLDMLDDSGDEPSGESRRRKDAPLTSAVRTYSSMFSETWAELLGFALKVKGFGDARVKVTFAPAEVVSDAEGWATIKAKIEAGVPVRTALSEAGYSEEQIEEWYPEGEENNLRVVDLEAVSRILQQLGSAVALDIITAEEARALLPEGILPEGAPTPVALPAPDLRG